ncbi:hypothetical protein MWN33_08545 [Starkeya koreensis]|uniref:Nickel/cobalt transporter regulator n=1 Tax=Ancylobacter koreensis TaxID=266121 RepID=A0ABT0DLB6_9HYPH|nr:hypothetical protein [Ancylobacter koreensis]MCK0208077.1 hypothetical protein [Ancylobacter koreensis]
MNAATMPAARTKRLLGLGAAALLGTAVLAASPASAQEVYVRGPAPLPPGTVIVEEPGYGPGYGPGYLAPGGHVIVREATPPVVVREAPQRVIVTDPMGGPYAREVYVRRPAPPEPLPGGYYDDAYDGGCRTLERQTRSGLVTVSTVCD